MPCLTACPLARLLLARPGYIESLKSLREQLIVQEWDLNQRHLAKRRGVAMFEKYVAEKGLLEKVGGYATLSALYEVRSVTSGRAKNTLVQKIRKSGSR